MKIGVISINMYSKGLNFACPLHSYAFQQFLLQNGIENTIISYKPNYYEGFNLQNPYKYYKEKYDAKQQKAAAVSDPKEKERILKNSDTLKEKRDLWEPLQEEREIRYSKLQNFIDKNYIRTETCYDSDLLEVEDPGFDCYICATDVIWKNTPGFGFDRGFFLGSKCMENKHKIAYSASRGAHFAKSKEEDGRFFSYLEDFDAISVREKTLQHYIEQNTGKSVPVVLDPVLLQDRSFYENISVKPPEEHYVLLYYVMEQAKETIRQAAVYAQAHHQKIIEITDQPVGEGRLAAYPGVDYTLRYSIGIEEWLGYIRYADCIFTNSFHACCLSVLFEKQFFAGHRNSEKVSLFMDSFGLSYRNLADKGDPVLSPPAPIAYEKVRPILEEKRKESSDFILNAIHEAERSPRQKKDYSASKKALTYQITYDSGTDSENLSSTWDKTQGTLTRIPSGAWEYTPNSGMKHNDGSSRLDANHFSFANHCFKGWKIRVKIDNHWFWYLEDGSLCPRSAYVKSDRIKYFQDEELLPYIPVNHISLMVAEAVWNQPFLHMAQQIKHFMASKFKK